MSMGSRSVVAIIPKGFGGRVHRPFMHGRSYRRCRAKNMHLLCSTCFYSVYFSDLTILPKLTFLGPDGLFSFGSEHVTSELLYTTRKSALMTSNFIGRLPNATLRS